MLSKKKELLVFVSRNPPPIISGALVHPEYNVQYAHGYDEDAISGTLRSAKDKNLILVDENYCPGDVPMMEWINAAKDRAELHVCFSSWQSQPVWHQVLTLAKIICPAVPAVFTCEKASGTLETELTARGIAVWSKGTPHRDLPRTLELALALQAVVNA